MKNILVINHSQSGQLHQIVDNFIKPLSAHNLERIKFKPNRANPFPWDTFSFYNEMPDTVLEQEAPLEHLELKRASYDLVIVGYQPWFLSPSPYITSLLKNQDFLAILKDTPVITIIGARNMWLNAQESVKKRLADAGANLVANVPFIDREPNMISAITIEYWMSTGKKDRKMGIFPTPGINSEDINGANRFGEILAPAIENNAYGDLQQRFMDTGLIGISDTVLFIEARAKKIFNIWASLIIKKGNTEPKRRKFVTLFRYYLKFALFGVAPILLAFYFILVWPFTARKRKEKKRYFYGLNQSSK